MTRLYIPLLAVTLAACQRTAAQAPPPPEPREYTPADVQFMTGMIYHHAQALLIAGWAPSHGAGADVRTLCERIINAQKDEIKIMSTWLRDRNEPVPTPEPEHMMHDMTHVMPGMLTAEQLARLDRARGPEFDELFLKFMIQHHEGAVAMVNDLFARGAGEENPVYKIAGDVFADQTTEIERMQRMLAARMFGPLPTTNPR